MAALHPSILNLAWDDLREWADPAVVSRGRSYTGYVEDPRLTEGDGLLGWVFRQ